MIWYTTWNPRRVAATAYPQSMSYHSIFSPSSNRELLALWAGKLGMMWSGTMEVTGVSGTWSCGHLINTFVNFSCSVIQAWVARHLACGGCIQRPCKGRHVRRGHGQSGVTWGMMRESWEIVFALNLQSTCMIWMISNACTFVSSILPQCTCRVPFDPPASGAAGGSHQVQGAGQHAFQGAVLTCFGDACSAGTWLWGWKLQRCHLCVSRCHLLFRLRGQGMVWQYWKNQRVMKLLPSEDSPRMSSAASHGSKT